MKAMASTTQLENASGKVLPVVIERGEDGYYIVECTALDGAFTQGETLDEAMHNIREVIELILEEPDAQQQLEDYNPKELSLHTITL